MKVTEPQSPRGLAECAPHDAIKGKRPGSCLRALADVVSGQVYRVHTWPIDSGGQCEVLAGATLDGLPLVFRQFRLLPPRQRDILPSGRRRPRVSQPGHVAADVAMARAAGGPCAPLVFLQTYRGDAVSKMYVGMQPMQADLLGCARALQDTAAAPALRAAFTLWALRQLAPQLAALHARGIVHRDLRLDNVLCGRDDAGQLGLSIADFGNARAGRLQALAKPTGPLPYCAPEVLRASYTRNFRARDAAARDVWALGIVSIILLLGCNPFDPERDERDDDLVADTLWAYSEPNGPRLTSALDDFGALGALIRRMLHPAPESRPTAAEAVDCLPELDAASCAAAAAFAAQQRGLEVEFQSRLEELS